MIDADGFRANIGIILHNDSGELFWARRVGNTGWQFPQGGMADTETPQEAMYRELQEETGLLPEHVELVCESRRWLRYSLPDKYVRRYSQPLCLGQKQRWFLLRFTGEPDDIRLAETDSPEFETWRWVDYWTPVEEVVKFKRRVYRAALGEFFERLFPGEIPRPPSLYSDFLPGDRAGQSKSAKSQRSGRGKKGGRKRAGDKAGGSNNGFGND